MKNVFTQDQSKALAQLRRRMEWLEKAASSSAVKKADRSRVESHLSSLRIEVMRAMDSFGLPR